jgi:hypothetical protein
MPFLPPSATTSHPKGKRQCRAIRLTAKRRLPENFGHTLGKATPEYRSWKAMIQRCCNLANPKFEKYGGRGILVCERWRVFENFFADMGPRPEGKTLDRYPNNDGNYEPGNCRWATIKEQQANRNIDHARESDARKRSWVTRRG